MLNYGKRFTNSRQSQVIEWDTTKNLVDYPYNIKKIYFKEASKNRKNFTNWVNKVCKRFNKDIDWWVSLPASRNPYAVIFITLFAF